MNANVSPRIADQIADAPMSNQALAARGADSLLDDELGLPADALQAYRGAERELRGAGMIMHEWRCQCLSCRSVRAGVYVGAFDVLVFLVTQVFGVLGLARHSHFYQSVYLAVLLPTILLGASLGGLGFAFSRWRKRQSFRRAADHLLRLEHIYPMASMVRLNYVSGRKRLGGDESMPNMMSMDPNHPEVFISENPEWYFSVLTSILRKRPTGHLATALGTPGADGDVEAATRFAEATLDESERIGQAVYRLADERQPAVRAMERIGDAVKTMGEPVKSLPVVEGDIDFRELDCLIDDARKRLSSQSCELDALLGRCERAREALVRHITLAEEVLMGQGPSGRGVQALRRRLVTMKDALSSLDAVDQNARLHYDAVSRMAETAERFRTSALLLFNSQKLHQSSAD